MELGRENARAQNGFTRHLGHHERIAIAVPTHPRANANRRGLRRQTTAHGAQERVVEVAQKARGRIPEHLVHEHVASARFVDGCRLAAPQVVGTPPGCNFPAKRFMLHAPLGRKLLGLVTSREGRGDASLLCEDRASRGLRRVRRQHELDLERAQAVEDAILAHALRAKPMKRVLERPKGWPLGLAQQAASTLAPAIVLLGDRRQGEEMSEGARERKDAVGVESGKARA